MQKQSGEPERDTPLPATLWFVMIMGACFFAGWFLLYALLRSRW